MPGLGRVTADLARYRKEFEARLGPSAAAGFMGQAGAGRLVEIADFGDDPGELRMLAYVPAGLEPGAPLVVALHGCTQTGAGYDLGAGWSTLADRHGFALLVPEQRRANNPNLCFNWFQPGDAKRDRGEAKSIRDMTAFMLREHGLDPARVFVTGLSAGGAMTSVMLAAYPDMFAGGAIIAGLPYGAATNVQQALEAMNGGKPRPAREWGYLVRRASAHKGPWPLVSIWHGGADATVQPANAAEIVKQWTDLHGLPLYPSEAEENDGHLRRVWRNPEGLALIESHTIAGMAHGTPIAPGSGATLCGHAAPYIIDVGISSSYEIARFWGLTAAVSDVATPPAPAPAQVRAEPQAGLQPSAQTPRPAPAARPGAALWDGRRGSEANALGEPQATIERALRQAGLMKR